MADVFVPRWCQIHHDKNNVAFVGLPRVPRSQRPKCVIADGVLRFHGRGSQTDESLVWLVQVRTLLTAFLSHLHRLASDWSHEQVLSKVFVTLLKAACRAHTNGSVHLTIGSPSRHIVAWISELLSHHDLRVKVGRQTKYCFAVCKQASPMVPTGKGWQHGDEASLEEEGGA